jgi:AcrR family transcriptional regulator
VSVTTSTQADRGGSAVPPGLTTSERILVGAAEMTAGIGWSGVTMAGLAERVGVSRQTVYNEWGNRDRLAEAMVLRELGAFLDQVDAGFDTHPSDVRAGTRAAIDSVLGLARVNPLLRAIVTATHGAETELVPLLTTRADVVIAVASERVRDRLRMYVEVDEARLRTVADLLVRTVLSHVMQPSPDTSDVARALAEATDLLLASERT